MNKQPKNSRQKLLELLGEYWWILIILVVILAITTDVPIFNYILIGIGAIFALVFFGPFLIQFLLQFFSPIFLLIASLIEHFKESKGYSVGKRYFFIPASIFAITGFLIVEIILSFLVLVLSFLIWSRAIGYFFTIIGMLFLAPITIITAPFVAWAKGGFAEFLSIGIFFLITFFWYSFSKMAFTEDYWKSTPDTFLGYSPQTFLLGALSFQIIALPLYQFGFLNIGNIISDLGGFIFLLLAFIAALKWRTIKNKLSDEEKENLYRPSVWIYIFGFFLTDLLFARFKEFNAPTAVLFWLNAFFLVSLILRFFGIFRRKKPKVLKVENQIDKLE